MKNEKEKGFTLIEVLLSITILTIVLTTFFQFFSQSMLFSSRNEEKQQTIHIARQMMNELQENPEAFALLQEKSAAVTDITALKKLVPQLDNIDQLNNEFILAVSPQKKERFIQVRITITSRSREDISASTYGLVPPQK